MITKFKLYENLSHWLLKQGKSLGKGGFGEAFDVIGEPDKAIKITTDESEYKTAKRLIGVNNEYIANYYFAEPYDDKYLLVMDKIQTHIDDELNVIIDKFNIYMYDDDENFYHETIFSPEEIEFIIEDFSETFDEDKVRMVVDSLQHIVTECKENNIYTNDFHSGNMGMKNNHLIFFDVGATD